MLDINSMNIDGKVNLSHEIGSSQYILGGVIDLLVIRLLQNILISALKNLMARWFLITLRVKIRLEIDFMLLVLRVRLHLISTCLAS